MTNRFAQTKPDQDTSESMLYEMVMVIQTSRNPFARKDVDDQTLIDPMAISAVRQRLQAVNITYESCDVDFTEIDFKDTADVGRVLYFVGVENHDRRFLGGYVVSRGVILAKYES